MRTYSRREALTLGGLTIGGAAVGPRAVAAATPARGDRPALRLAYLTDMHVQPELSAGEGWAEVLRHVHAATPGFDAIMTGGDLIMDAFEATQARTKAQWDLFADVLAREATLPTIHTIGNHDVWGWRKSASGATGAEPAYGKRWACDVLKLDRPYHARTLGGWKLIVLDSTFPSGEGYVGRIDDEQLDWLRGELSATPRSTPIAISSHIPILSITALFNMSDGSLAYSPSNMHGDGLTLHRLLAAAGNVRVCLSGHIHLVERMDVDGVAYLCCGAVSGNWWKGRYGPCAEGYSAVDLFADGAVASRYVEWGWRARER